MNQSRQILKWSFILSFLLTIPLKAQHREYHVSAIAGGGSAEGVSAHTSSLQTPRALAVDFAGNVYIADDGLKRIRKIDTNGIVRTIAGDGRNVYLGDEGEATEASFRYIWSIAIDKDGDVYVSDWGRLRKINSSTGVIQHIAGKSTQGYGKDGILATETNFTLIQGLAVDDQKNIYLCDKHSRRIRKIDVVSKVVSTIAGGGANRSIKNEGLQATNVRLEAPLGITLDKNNNIYFSEGHRIRKVDYLTGIISTIAGDTLAGFSGDGGPASSALLNNPMGLAIDDEYNLYVADNRNHRIRKIDGKTGIITTVIGGGYQEYLSTPQPGTKVSISYPKDVAIDKKGNVYTVNGSSARKLDVSTNTIYTLAGNSRYNGYSAGFYGDGSSALTAKLNTPNKLTLFNNQLLFADTKNYRIRQIDLTTNTISTLIGRGSSITSGDGLDAIYANIGAPEGVLVDAKNNIYITHTTRVRKINRATNIINTYAGSDTSAYVGDGGLATLAGFRRPHSLAIDQENNLYISDYYLHVVRKVNASTGIITTVAGNGSPGFSGDSSLAINAQLRHPTGIVIDSVGNLLIADWGNHRVRKVDAETGIITTFAGDGGTYYAGDHVPAVQFSLSNPYGLAFDKSGNLFITASNRVLKIDSTGIVSTIAGNGIGGYSKAGVGTNATINQPKGIAIADDGVIYVSDASNQILKLNPYAPDVDIKTNNILIKDGDAQSFGHTELDSSVTLQFVIENKGISDLLIDRTSITGEFELIHHIPPSIAPGDSILVSLKMNAQNAGHKRGRFILYNNDLDEAKYTINLAGEVKKALQQISFAPLLNKPYNVGSITLDKTSNRGLPITYTSSNPEVATISGNQVNITGVGTAIITAYQPGNNNYHAAKTIAQTLVVTKALQKINFDKMPIKYYRDEAFTLTAKSTSGLAVSYTSSNPEVAIVVGNVVAIVGAGNTTITASQLGNGSFLPALEVAQTLTVKKIPQTILFNLGLDTLKSLNSKPFALNGLSTSGLPIQYESADPKVAIITGNVIVIKGKGTTTITAIQVGNQNFLPASQVSQKLRVTIGRATNLQARVAGRHTILISWEIALNQIRQTRIERSDGSPNNFIPILTDNITQYRDTSLMIRPGITYYYRVIAKSDGGVEALPSDTIGVKIPLDELVTGSQQKLSKSINIYPNPSNQGVFHIQAPSHILKNAKTTITNAQGQVIKHYRQMPPKVNLKLWPRGIYYLKIITNQKEITKKLIKK